MMRYNDAIPSGERPAVPAPPDLYAEYKDDPGRPTGGVTTRIYAFSIEGHPLVLDHGGSRLVRPEALANGKMTYVGIQLPVGPPLTGPFTPAPPGLVAVFGDGHEEPVLYYDVHGRAVLMIKDHASCDLFLAEDANDVVRVEYRPSATE